MQRVDIAAEVDQIYRKRERRLLKRALLIAIFTAIVVAVPTLMWLAAGVVWVKY